MAHEDLLAGLNQPQREAVTARPGPVLVLAGPGSGKTRVLTNRIAYMIREEGVPPWRIMAVTFTNKAAREMRHRIESLVGADNLRGLTMGTFHATCVLILRREVDSLPEYSKDFVIFDTDDQRQVMKQALAQLNIDDKRHPPAKVLNNVSAAKNELITPDEFQATNHVSEIVRRAYSKYQEILQANNALDFDDLLMQAVLLFDRQPDVLRKYQERYTHVLVDEFQDTNTSQYELLKRLAAAHRNILVVGDSDQSIYKWRGADFRNIRRFQKQYPDAQTILLEQNYRSTQMILDAAKAVIRHNPERVDKELFTTRQSGAKVEVRQAYDDREEAGMVVDTIAAQVLDGYDPGDFAVMYRTNAQSRALEEAFLQRGLPYKLVGATRFYSRREVKDLIAYLRLVHNPLDAISFRRAVNTPPRGIGSKTQQRLEQWGAIQGLQPGEALLRLVTDPDAQHPFRTRAANALTDFGELLNRWLHMRESVNVGELLDTILDDIDFQSYLDDGSDEGRDRWANVQELRGVAHQSQRPLVEFLEEVALVADVDDLEEETSAPTLLTLHAAKGLEFPVVFITGLEDGLLPHSRSFDDPDSMAEERRLFYVGLTRAKDQVYLLYAFRRTSWGQADVSEPSRFLDELPPEVVEGRLPQRRSKNQEWRWSSENRGGSSTSVGSYGAKSDYVSARSNRARPADSSNRVSASKSPASRRTSPLRKERADSKYKAGQRVRHERFGDGIVVDSKARGEDEEVTVAFSENGVKTLVASLANLEIRK